MRRFYVAGIIVLMVAVPAGGQTVSRSVLPNGLTVLAVQSDVSTVAGIALVLGVSVGDEPHGLEGARALLQQMIVIDDHERRSERPQPISARVDSGSAGLSVNTDWDFVEIGFATAVEELCEALALLAESSFDVELTQGGLERASALVSQAHDMSHQSPVQSTFDLFRSAFYGRHPMGRSLYGHPESFEAMELSALQGFRDRYYVPANARLCVVSPLPTAEAVAAVGESFAAFRATALPPPADLPSPPPASRVEVGESYDLAQASLVVGVPLPGYGDEQFYAGEMIGALLEGRGGRLRRDLGLLQGLGLSIPTRLLDQHYPLTALSVPMTHRPYLAVHALSSPRQIERVRTGVLRHLLALREGTVTSAELERARQRLINSHRYATRKHADAALYIARNDLFGLGDADEAVAAIEQVTEEDLSTVAREYFDRHAVGVQMPAI